MNDVETIVRRSLAQWADEVRPSWTASDDVLHRVEERRHRRRNRVVGAVVAVAAVGAVGGAVLARDEPMSVRTASTGGVGGAGDVVPVGDPALFALDVPGWSVEYVTLGNYAAGGVYPTRMTTIRFTNGAQNFEIVSYPLGSRDNQHSNGTIDVRGLVGRLIPEGEDRVRIDWDEGGQTLEADGSPFGTPEELVALLEQLRSVDDAGFVASLPAGVGEGLLVGVRSYPLEVPGFVTWYPGRAVECNVDGRDVGPATASHPVDPVTGCVP